MLDFGPIETHGKLDFGPIEKRPAGVEAYCAWFPPNDAADAAGRSPIPPLAAGPPGKASASLTILECEACAPAREAGGSPLYGISARAG